MLSTVDPDTLVGLGIDAGGTFTDVALVDARGSRILAWSKAPTTQDSPIDGIHEALESLPRTALANVSFVSLATTFATNAIVQGKGARAGLILIGYDQDHPTLSRISPVIFIEGGHDYWGEEITSLDIYALEKKLPFFAKQVDAIAVSSFFSIRNPDHENLAAEYIRSRFNLPVVLGHQLSLRLDAPKRAITAWWNARLIPLVSQLIEDTEKVLEQFNINAPLLIVKGDGTLMSASVARRRPVETILSGPAAGVLGARYLTGQDDGLVVDMGGTTTDMAILRNGRVEIDPNGAEVGNWKTQVEAARIRTTGLGGDSLIWTRNGHIHGLQVGPQRVEPLCSGAEKFQEILPTLEELLKISKSIPLSLYNPCSFYVIRQDPVEYASLIPHEGLSRPASEYHLLSNENSRIDRFLIRELEQHNIVTRISLTPTDFCVARGTYKLGSREAAQRGISLFAKCLGVSEAELHHALDNEIARRLATEAVNLCLPEDAPMVTPVMHHWFSPDSQKQSEKQVMEISLKLKVPVLAIGAPAKAWLPKSFQYLGTSCVLPGKFMVGTAIGAAVANISFTVQAEIRPTTQDRFILFAPDAKTEFGTLNEAIDAGKSILERLAKERMQANGVKDFSLDWDISKHSVDIPGGKLHLFTTVTLRATSTIPVTQS